MVKVREFVHTREVSQKWIVYENEDGTLRMYFCPFSIERGDWELIDRMKAEGNLEYLREYDIM